MKAYFRYFTTLNRQELVSTANGPVTLLRMRTTYELRAIIIELTFIRATYAKKPLENTELCLYLPYTYRIAPMSGVEVTYDQLMLSVFPAYDQRVSRISRV